MYTLKGLKQAASYLKKLGVLKGFAVTKATKAELEKVLKENSYDMSQIKTKKTKAPKKMVGRPRKTPIGPKLKRGMTYVGLVNKYAKVGNTELEAMVAKELKKKAKKAAKQAKQATQTIAPAPVVAGKRRRGRPKGSKNKPRN